MTIVNCKSCGESWSLAPGQDPLYHDCKKPPVPAPREAQRLGKRADAYLATVIRPRDRYQTFSEHEILHAYEAGARDERALAEKKQDEDAAKMQRMWKQAIKDAIEAHQELSAARAEMETLRATLAEVRGKLEAVYPLEEQHRASLLAIISRAAPSGGEGEKDAQNHPQKLEAHLSADKLPPRVMHLKGSRMYMEKGGVGTFDMTAWQEYLSLSEHLELLAAARAEAFMEMAAECMRQAELTAGEPFNNLDGAQEWARAAGIAKARAERAKGEE